MFNGAVPPFDLGWAGAALALTRAVWLAGLLSSGGALLFSAFESGAQGPAFRGRLMRLVLASLGVAAAGWLAWMVGQTASFVGSLAPGEVAGALADVLGQTEFGRVGVVQLALLAAAACTLAFAGRGWARWAGAVLALGAVGLQVGHLHAWAMVSGVGVLTVGALLHVLGASAWLGGLLPLRLLLLSVSASHAAAASRRFSLRASVFVAMVATGALLQGWRLLGGVPGLFGTSYGWVAILKAVLFATLLAMALRNRFRLTPALAKPDPDPAHWALLRAVAVETGVGLAIVLAACLLGALQPGMHAEPVWPFRARPDFSLPAAPLATVMAAVPLLLALAVLILARGWRRLPALALLAAALWFGQHRMAPLFVAAVPTSFFTSPTGFAATSIAEGAALYRAHCADCHGPDGHGDGPRAAALALPQGDLTVPALSEHADGEVFWWLTHGIDSPLGGLAMPGFAKTLDADARWHLIDFLRARAGATASAKRAPDLAADCSDGRSVGLTDLRGRPVLLVFSAATVTTPGATTILVAAGDMPPPAGACLAGDPTVPVAYSIATGVPVAALAGRGVLIDANGWLRGVLPAGLDGAALADAVGHVAATPLANDAAPPVHHHG